MKKLILLFVSVALFASVTAQVAQKGYTVSGTTKGLADGDTVYLATMYYLNFIPTDSTVVKDGKFFFKGVQENPELRFVLCVKNKQSVANSDFILENTDIKVNLDRGSTVRSDAFGGRDNDLWNKYVKLDDEMSKKMDPSWKTAEDTTKTADVRAAAKKELDKLEKEQVDFHAKFIRENLPSGVSDILLGFYSTTFDKETFEGILAEMKKVCPQDPVYLEFAHEMEALRTTAVGCRYVDIALKDPSGKVVKVSDYVGKNKITMIDFWASWCGPCRAEMPNVIKAYKTYKDKGFAIVGVSLDNDGKSWRNAIKTLGIPWPQISDLKGWNSAGAAAYNIKAIPATVLINQKGEIIAKDLRGEDLEKKLSEVLN